MLHRQFQEELAQRRRGPIRKRLEPDWQDAGMNLLDSVNRLADLMDEAEQRLIPAAAPNCTTTPKLRFAALSGCATACSSATAEPQRGVMAAALGHRLCSLAVVRLPCWG